VDEALVSGRECGPCTVCCSALTVDTADFQKLPGVTCPNCVEGKGCQIYETRPPVCRIWFCAWRALPWVHEALRPHESEVLTHLTIENLPEGYAYDTGIEFLVLSSAGLKAVGLAETICRAITSRMPAFLAVPGAPGFRGSRWLLNELLFEIAESGNEKRLLAELKKLYVSARLLAQVDATGPVALLHGSTSLPPKPASPIS
jgi:hypothetical protein